jgi:chaperone modulatory protein CbpM
MGSGAISVELLDDSTPYALRELCELCGVHAELVIEMVDAGVLTPVGSAPSAWQFSVQATIRLQKAQRLRRDLDMNLAGVAVALDLIEDLDQARKRLKTLERRLAQLDSNT